MKNSIKMDSVLAMGALVAIGLAVFWPGLYGGFIFDDFANLVDDPDWKVTSWDIQSWRGAASLGISSDSGRPLAMLSFALNYFLTGMDPFWLKMTGLGLHLLNGTLVLALCRQLIAQMPPRHPDGQIGLYGTMLLAFAWTLHPLQVSSALYIVQRMEIGAATGTLIALIAYIQARTMQREGRKYWPWVALSALGFSFGLGFKETAILTPAYMFLVEVFALKFKARGIGHSRTLIATYAFGAITAILIYSLKILPAALAPGAYAARDFTLMERLLTQLDVLTTYLGQIVMPIPDRQTFYYDNFPIADRLFGPSGAWGSLLLLSALVASAWTIRHRWPLTSFGIAWFFIAHILTSNVVPFELAFEHRNYLALLGILVALLQPLSSLVSSLNLDARRTLAALPVVTLAALCITQVHTWADPFRLALTLDSRNPGSVRASYDLGKLMAERAEGIDSPLFSMALKQFDYAGNLPSRSPLPEQASIIMRASHGLPVPSEVWDRMRRKLGAGPAGPEQISAVYGVLDCRIKNLCDLDDHELFHTFLAALERNPESSTIHSLYASFAWNVIGDRELAIEMMRHATELAPGNTELQQNLARFQSAVSEKPNRSLPN